MDEKRLIKKAAAGDQKAYEQLVSDCAGQVYALALKLLKNPQDAEDASQEAFVKAWRSLPGFKGECRFASWMYRLTYNTCLDMLRRQKNGTILSLTETESEEEAQIDIPDSHPGPEEETLRRERTQILYAEIDKLSDKLREPLLLREAGGKSYDEIGCLLGIETGTVKSRISRARKSLADALRQNGTFSEYVRQTKENGGDR